MAQPIRWDNIVSRGNGEAVAGINSAASLFRGAFTDLQDTLKDRENIEAANWQNTKVNNTNTYLDQVAQMRDIDQLKAGQGQLDALKQQFGAQIDSGAVRGAMDQRMSTLMDQRAKEVGYNKLMRDERTAPIMDTLKRAALEGKKDVFDQAMAAYTAAGGTDGAGAVKYMLDRERQVVEQGQGDKLFNDKLVTSAAERTHMVNQDRNAEGRLAVDQFRAETDRDHLKIAQSNHAMSRDERNQEALNKKYSLLMASDARTVDSAEGMTALTNTIKAMPVDELQKQSLIKAAGKLGEYRVPLRGTDGKPILDSAGKPMLGAMSTADALKALLGSEDDRTRAGRWWGNQSEQGDDAIKSAKVLADSPGAALQAMQTMGIKQSIQQDIETLRRRQRDGSIKNEFSVEGNQKRMEEALNRRK